MAPDAPTELTGADIHTIMLALNYAAIERRSFVAATRNCDMDDAHNRSKDMVDRFEKLHQKLFGRPTDDALQAKEDREANYVSIHDLPLAKEQ